MNLDLLIQLQQMDSDVDALQTALKKIPGQKDGVQKKIEQGKADLEAAKAESKRLILDRKGKESEIAQKEEEIRKHQSELNQVKTNDAYKALLGEIEHAKAAISKLEDDLLQLMERGDELDRKQKGRDADWAGAEATLKAEIAGIDQKTGVIDGQISDKKAARKQIEEKVPKPLLERYEKLRKAKKGVAIVPVKGRMCGGCHLGLAPNLVNEVLRNHEVVFCEHCERILYIPASNSEPSAAPH